MIAKEHYTKFDCIHIVNILLPSVLVTFFCFSVTSILKEGKSSLILRFQRVLFMFGPMAVGGMLQMVAFYMLEAQEADR